MSLDQLTMYRDALNEAIGVYADNRKLATDLGAATAQLADRDATITRLTAELEARAKPVPSTSRDLLCVDKGYSPDAFTGDKQLWNNRLSAAIKDARVRAAIRQTAATSTPELVGFTLKDYVVALSNALDATGNAAYLHEIVDVMDVLKARQGFTVTIAKDRAMIASLYALVAYVCAVNFQADSRFAWAATCWRRRALEMCETGVPSDDILHPFAASLETAWYLWLLTGDVRFQDDADAKRVELVKSIPISDEGRATWHHRPFFAWGKGGADGDPVPPRTTYTSYIIQSVVMLKRTGLDTVPMESLVKTALVIIRENGTIARLLDGTGDEAVSKITTRNWSLLCAYEPTGELAKRLVAANTPTQIYTAAGMLHRGNI